MATSQTLIRGLIIDWELKLLTLIASTYVYIADCFHVHTAGARMLVLALLRRIHQEVQRSHTLTQSCFAQR